MKSYDNFPSSLFIQFKFVSTQHSYQMMIMFALFNYNQILVQNTTKTIYEFRITRLISTNKSLVTIKWSWLLTMVSFGCQSCNKHVLTSILDLLHETFFCFLNPFWVPLCLCFCLLWLNATSLYPRANMFCLAVPLTTAKPNILKVV